MVCKGTNDYAECEEGKHYHFAKMESDDGVYYRVWPDPDNRPGYYQTFVPAALERLFTIL